MSTRKRLFLLITLLVVGGCTFELVREIRGPSPATAFHRVFGEPIPDYVGSLESDYSTHLKGSRIYLGFIVPTNKISDWVDVKSSSSVYDEETDSFRTWHEESKFRQFFIDGFPDLKTCRIVEERMDGESRVVVFSPVTGHVFCYRVVDSDFKP